MKTTTGEAAKKDAVKQRIRRFAKAYFDKPHLKNFAETCGVDYTHLLNMSELASPTMRLLKAFQSKGDMSMDWFFTGKGPMLYSERLALAESSDAKQEVLEELHALENRIKNVQKLLTKGEPIETST